MILLSKKWQGNNEGKKQARNMYNIYDKESIVLVCKKI